MMADTMKSVLDVSFVERNGMAEDIGALAAFLASGDAGFMNGENVMCDGGHSVARRGVAIRRGQSGITTQIPTAENQHQRRTR